MPRLLAILLLLVMPSIVGCQWGWSSRAMSRESKFIEPAISMEMTCNELVDYLNQKTTGLRSWRCPNTTVAVSMPGLPLPQKLKGSIACSAPGNFRLIADGAMLVHADFGANDDYCWAFMKPGEPAVLTWRHEDSHLLQHLPGCPPRLEPSWLMTVLGVRPLDPDDYELTSAPQGSRELWLVAIESAPDGTTLRRTIKVDTVSGTIREHALYDSERQPLLRVQLGQYRRVGPYHLPHQAKIRFEREDTELLLSFASIHPDYEFTKQMWTPPAGRGIEFVDLGDLVRQNMHRDGQQPMKIPVGFEREFDDDPSSSHHSEDGGAIREMPEFDTLPAERPMNPPRRQSWWNPFRR